MSNTTEQTTPTTTEQTTAPDQSADALAQSTLEHPAVKLGWQSATADVRLTEALRRLTADADAVALGNLRRVFIVGYVAARLSPGSKATAPTIASVKAAQIMLGKANANSKADSKRTDEEEKFYATARKAWERLLAATGVVSTETRGGARERTATATAKATAPQSQLARVAPEATDGVTDAPAGKYSNVTHGIMYLQQTHATLLAMLDKHPAAFDTDMREMVIAHKRDVDALAARIAAAQ